jgi:dihydroorotate dehydrogenase
MKAAKLAQAEPHVLQLIAWWFEASKNPQPTIVAGITFPNKVGLAAGFDKNGEILPFLQALGFGFVEIGTVLPYPQKGNERPRLFRIPGEEVLINRMGFNGEGAVVVARNLERYCRTMTIPVGINFGKMKGTPNEDAVGDYINVWKRLRIYGAYGVANISSPNTPGLRELQGSKYIERFVRELVEAEHDFAGQAGEWQKPMFIKLAPDLSYSELAETIGACESAGASGFIIGNTTLDRPLKEPHSPFAKEAGGLSGNPLFHITWNKFRCTRLHTTLPIIFVGGLDSAERVKAVFDEGADLVQLYTGLIYKGPRLISTARSVA